MIKLLALDIDGTMTDWKIYMGKDGELMKAFDAKDGYAIKEMLPKYGILPVVITGRSSDIVKRRCEELGIQEVHQGCTDKKEKLLEIAERLRMEITEEHKIQNSAYIGDDLPDLSGMEAAETIGCPADAVADVKQIADYVCRNKGGDGAIREFIEWLIDGTSTANKAEFSDFN